MKYNFDEVKDTCISTVNNIKGTVEKTKGITIHPRLDASLYITNDKNEVFGTGIYFNKKISLFKIISIGVCVAAGLMLVAALLSSIRDCCCDSHKKSQDEI